MNLLELLTQNVDTNELVNSLSNHLNVDKNQVETVTRTVIPTLIADLGSNVQSEKGAKSLMNALDKHMDVDINDMQDFLSNVDLKDGQKILTHIFGKKQTQIEKDISDRSGLEINQVTILMATLAPIVMAFLGNQKKESEDNFDVTEVFGSLVGAQGLSSMLTSFMITDNKQKQNPVSKVLGGLGSLLKKQ